MISKADIIFKLKLHIQTTRDKEVCARLKISQESFATWKRRKGTSHRIMELILNFLHSEKINMNDFFYKELNLKDNRNV